MKRIAQAVTAVAVLGLAVPALAADQAPAKAPESIPATPGSVEKGAAPVKPVEKTSAELSKHHDTKHHEMAKDAAKKDAPKGAPKATGTTAGPAAPKGPDATK